jgi:predicted transcriptional regulator
MARMRRRKPRLTAGELELLDVLWRRGGSTLSEVQAALARAVGYTTVQTRLNRLVAKGVACKTDARPAHYSAAIPPESVTRSDLDSLLDRVTCGRVVPLIAHLVRERTLSPEELDEIRGLIDEAEARAREDKEGR